MRVQETVIEDDAAHQSGVAEQGTGEGEAQPGRESRGKRGAASEALVEAL